MRHLPAADGCWSSLERAAVSWKREANRWWSVLSVALTVSFFIYFFCRGTLHHLRSRLTRLLSKAGRTPRSMARVLKILPKIQLCLRFQGNNFCPFAFQPAQRSDVNSTNCFSGADEVLMLHHIPLGWRLRAAKRISPCLTVKRFRKMGESAFFILKDRHQSLMFTPDVLRSCKSQLCQKTFLCEAVSPAFRAIHANGQRNGPTRRAALSKAQSRFLVL